MYIIIHTKQQDKQWKKVQLIYSLTMLVSMNCISHRSVNGWIYIYSISNSTSISITDVFI